MKKYHHLLIGAGIFMVVCLSHILSKNLYSSDSMWSIHTTVSILQEGNTDLNEYRDLLASKNFYAIERINGHYYTQYPIGVSLLAIPFVIIMGRAPDYAGVIKSSAGVEEIVASFIVAAAAVFIYLLCKRLLINTFITPAPSVIIKA